MDTIKVNHGETKMVAHRGVSGLELENTVAAFIAAGNRSYYGVETDVHVTADGKFVVIHDETVGRVTTGEKGTGLNVEESTIEEISKVKLTSKYGGTRADLVIPMLADYIEICKYYGKVCVLEIKNEFPEDALIKMAEEIEALGYIDGTIFISFKENNLKILRKAYPDVKLQFLCHVMTDEILAMLDEYNFDLDIRHKDLTKEVVDLVHEHGHVINVWTVDDPERAELLASWGVDQITTNICE
ncbi:MAG: hypothetical protein IJ428_03130 [Clostridia bacterium]|nr:hypothetical protein [Clostridia bacterium]